MKIKIFTALAFLIVLGLSVQAQESNAVKQESYTALDYDNLLTKLKGGDTGIDYTALRMAFTQNKNYSSRGPDQNEKEKYFKPFAEKNYKEALKQATKALETNFVDANAHFVAYNSAKELKDAQKAEFHKTILLGLLNSMKNGNDGLSEKTPFKVITTDEENTMLRFMGFKTKSQNTQTIDGHQFDVLTAMNLKTNENVKYYFDIDILHTASKK